jgi:hypothetical protein
MYDNRSGLKFRTWLGTKFSACFKTLTELHALGYASMKLSLKSKTNRGLHGRDRMVVGFTTSCAISAFHYLPVSLSSNPARLEQEQYVTG